MKKLFEQGDSVLVRNSECSSYAGLELSRFNCTNIVRRINLEFIKDYEQFKNNASLKSVNQ